MKIQLASLPPQGVKVDFALTAEQLWERLPKNDRLREAITAPIQAHVEVDKIFENVNIHGTTQATMRPSCDYCLEAFDYPLQLKFQLTAVPRQTSSDADVGVLPLESDEINLATIVTEELLAGLPMNFKCQESCHGLCPHCGTNLNLSSCDCKKQ